MSQITRVYIAGPMRGLPYCNFGSFDYAANLLRLRGYKPISPADMDRAAGFDALAFPEHSDWSNVEQYGFDLREAIKRNFDALMSADAVYMLPGWRSSRGATHEVALAQLLDLPVWCGHVPVQEVAS